MLRILVGIRYVDQAGVKQYRANDMTRQMTDRLAVARVKFMYDRVQSDTLHGAVANRTQLDGHAHALQDP